MNTKLSWIEAIAYCKKSAKPWVMATVIGTKGSTPRDSGSKMVITEDELFDTVGGGKLEFLIIQKARELLLTGENQHSFEHFPLAAKSQQCCGGVMNVLLECFAEQTQDVHIFGAGHVAKALVSILGQLNMRVFWIDSRANEFPKEIPSNTSIKHYSDVIAHVNHIKPHAYTIILTHDHMLDYQLIEALLDRKDCQYIGLIGSKTKALRFQKRLRSASFSSEEINSVYCPIGLPEIDGKQPMEVAVSISAQLIQKMQEQTPKETTSRGVSWRELALI